MFESFEPFDIQTGTVTIHGRVEGHSIVLEVTNPVASGSRAMAAGVDADADLARPARAGNRMALDNIRQRMQLVFPGRSSVEVNATDGEYRVALRFPLVEGTPTQPWAGT